MDSDSIDAGSIPVRDTNLISLQYKVYSIKLTVENPPILPKKGSEK